MTTEYCLMLAYILYVYTERDMYTYNFKAHIHMNQPSIQQQSSINPLNPSIHQTHLIWSDPIFIWSYLILPHSNSSREPTVDDVRLPIEVTTSAA